MGALVWFISDIYRVVWASEGPVDVWNEPQPGINPLSLCISNLILSTQLDFGTNLAQVTFQEQHKA